MKKFSIALSSIIFLAGCVGYQTSVVRQPVATPASPELINQNLTQVFMHLTSSAFENNGNIPAKYTCDVANEVSPPLTISGVPEKSKSLVLIVDDPDAPSGDFVHWLVWNIDPTVTNSAENSVPKNAVQGTTGFGKAEWGGPCPPNGPHHYQFKLYSLDTVLDLPSSTTKKDLEKAIDGHIQAQTQLVGLYKRK